MFKYIHRVDLIVLSVVVQDKGVLKHGNSLPLGYNFHQQFGK